MNEQWMDEDEEPFIMPDIPENFAGERNSLSLIGRITNPRAQEMQKLIKEMPKKWQKTDRVRGIALSPERFQFIFRSAHDLEEILEKGLHCFNEWALIVDKWVENPPEDFLQHITVWVQIRNLPVNHYTAEAIATLGEMLGKVKKVAFDPEKPQYRDYVRVLVRMNVNKPLRRSRVVHFKGIPANILFHYERVQRRCILCQRITHDKMDCPSRGLSGVERNLNESQNPPKPQTQLLTYPDPLFGVLDEDQVGLDPTTGRFKIAKEVLDEFRRYLSGVSGQEKAVREERVRNQVIELSKNPFTAKTHLRLEQAPQVSFNVDKGKGHVFDYGEKDAKESLRHEGKLLAEASKAHLRFQSESERRFISSRENKTPRIEFPQESESRDVGEGSGSKAIVGKKRRRPDRSKRRKVEKPVSTRDPNEPTKKEMKKLIAIKKQMRIEKRIRENTKGERSQGKNSLSKKQELELKTKKEMNHGQASSGKSKETHQGEDLEISISTSVKDLKAGPSEGLPSSL